MTERWRQDIERDVALLEAHLAGGLDAVRSRAMMMPDFVGGPDVLDAWNRWMSAPARRAYRRRVAEELARR